MHARISRNMIAVVLSTGIAGLVAGCASMKSGSAPKEVNVTMDQLSEPARATVKKETAGGTVDKITREVERGKTGYDVEATGGDTHMKYLSDAADGKVWGTEVPIEFSQWPEPVRAAVEKYFGTTIGLIIM